MLFARALAETIHCTRRRNAAMTAPSAPSAPVTNEPPYSAFSQQYLRAHRPTLTPGNAAKISAVIALVFIPIGSWTLNTVNSLKEVVIRYDNLQGCADGFFPTDAEAAAKYSYAGAGTTCTATARTTRALKAPVYVHYELSNFFQNHRAYARDLDYFKMMGNFDAGWDLCTTSTHKQTAAGDTISPCGVQAWSYFNDTFALRVDNVATAIDETKIAWPSDKKFKFGDFAPENMNTDAATRGGSVIQGNVDDDEHFITWMRMAAKSDFRKLWGRVDVDIPANTEVKFTITNRYNTYMFDGRKSIVLSENSFMGGKNYFLPALYLFIGVVCAAWSVICVFMSIARRRRPEQTTVG